MIILIFLIATFLRIRLFLMDRSLWLDEAALALNIMDKNFQELLGPLNYAQSAPPGFLIFTKSLTLIFGYSENILRLIPFLAGIITVFAFYILFKNVFTENFSFKTLIITIAMGIIAFSYPLLYYTIEFKPYMIDVLSTIIILLAYIKYLKPADSKLNPKTEIVLSLILSAFPLFSFGSIFPLCAFLAISILKKRKILPAILGVSLLLNYLFIFKGISPETRVYQYWTPYFINFSPSKILPVFVNIFKFYFYPSRLILPVFILFLGGLIFLYKKDREIFKFALLTISGAFLASFVNIYPLYDRLSLFLYPIFLIIIIYPAYYITLKSPDIKHSRWINIPIYLFSGIFLISCFLYNPLNLDYYRREEIKPALKSLKHNLKDEKIVAYTGSHLAFRYYKKLFAFKNEAITCPQKGSCFEQIEYFCAKKPCYIVSASEIERNKNLLELGTFVENHNGKLIFYKNGAALFKINP